MDSSDPLLSSQRQSSNRHSRRLQALLPEVHALLEAGVPDRATFEADEDIPVAPEDFFDEFEVAELDLMLDVEEEVEVSTEDQPEVRQLFRYYLYQYISNLALKFQDFELAKITIPEDLEPKFLEFAYLNTIQNIETCGILAGSIVRTVF
jgi:hypothetical protein